VSICIEPITGDRHKPLLGGAIGLNECEQVGWAVPRFL
jgi:hypothetical protein